MLPQETLDKLDSLSQEKMNAVINFIDQLTASTDALDVFDALCEDGSKNPLSEQEINDFVSEVRKERRC
ncbi:hypothetical protein [Pseudobutyrivibrio sp.]|uniref:hypothetical protein n=1 Tax=Pseudobutyrivibrio sp. TaxID=2014367 RepID=UPI001D75AB4D|nr:hypothetical protein [Pseudobutyrivibrio sp.]MBE5911680.1 hypothetical protein [Pseudobutyrivibrio sp.]